VTEPPRNARPYDSVLDTIGWTPLIRLNRVTDGARTPVMVKAEFYNPGGSVKDRIGLAMIEAAERDGRLRPGGTIVEGTSGNTGVGLAIAAALKGYRCIFTMPDKMSQEKVRLLRAFGAEVIITPTAVAPDHPDNYVETAKRIAATTPGAILADQFYNPVNPETHYATTGPELWEQTEGRITHLVASAGTGGTISGSGRFLKEKNPDLRVIAGDPVGSIFAPYFETGEKTGDAPYKVEGIGNDKLPSTLWFDVIDEFHSINDRDAFRMARRLTREEGLFVGGSAGLIVHLAVQLAHSVDDPGALVVAILPDTGERYLSKLYNEEWMRENRLIEPERMTARTLIDNKDGDIPELVVIDSDHTGRDALGLITGHGISQLPVLQDGRCIGAVSEETLMARVIEDAAVLDAPVHVLMDPPLPAVTTDTSIEDIARALSRHNRAVTVQDPGGRVVGIITRYDLVRRLTG
jgi:cystathionine beta-synthase